MPIRYIYIYTQRCIYIYIYIYIYTHTHTKTHIYIYIYIYTHKDAYIYIYIYIYIHTHTHTHTQTYAHVYTHKYIPTHAYTLYILTQGYTPPIYTTHTQSYIVFYTHSLWYWICTCKMCLNLCKSGNKPVRVLSVHLLLIDDQQLEYIGQLLHPFDRSFEDVHPHFDCHAKFKKQKETQIKWK